MSDSQNSKINLKLTSRKTLPLFLLAIVCFYLTACSSIMHRQGLTNEGIKRYDAGQYALSIIKFRKAAEANNKQALHYLGRHYAMAQAVPRNTTTAAGFYQRAVDLNYPPSMNNLGLLYQHGDGVPRNLAKAEALFLQASKAGQKQSFANLGLLYYDQQKYDLAYQYLVRAAQDDIDLAQYRLGSMYFQGVGVDQDYQAAAKWLEPATDTLANAQYLYGLLFEIGQPYGKSQSRAIEWFEESATQGFAPAQQKLGTAYTYGIGVPVDFTKGFAWYSKAAEQGMSPSQVEVARAYLTGQGTLNNNQKAVEWLDKAVRQGNGDAHMLLGYCYGNGIGVRQNLHQAAYHCKAARDKWVKGAQVCLENIDKALAQQREQQRQQQRQQSSQYSRNQSGSDSSFTTGETAVGLAGIALLAYGLSELFSDDNSSSNSSTANTNSCRATALNRISKCEYSMAGCTSVGCDYELSCSKTRSGKSGYACMGFWEKFSAELGNESSDFYCDVENTKNRNGDLEVVIQNICY